MNYFRKHWRGELPLWKSFWVNGMGMPHTAKVTIAFLCKISTPFLISRFDISPTVPLMTFLLAILALMLFWSSVGIWRSARIYARKSVSPWGELAQGAVLVTVVVCVFKAGALIWK